MTSKVRVIIGRAEKDTLEDQPKLYSRFSELVEQALHARIIADAMWKFRHERGFRTGFNNSIVSFCHVALENFAAQQLWKLFDEAHSVLNVYYVVEHMRYLSLATWFKENLAKIKQDVDLISEWRHGIVGHRGKVGYFVPNEYEKKFDDARSSEKRMQDFLLAFLCQIKLEMQRVPVEKTLEELQLRLSSFEEHIKRDMSELFEQCGFSPIQDKDTLLRAVEYVATRTSELASKIVGRSFPIKYLTIFSHDQSEYETLVKILAELGAPYDENNGPRVTLLEPIVVGGNTITRLRIRKPDPNRPQVGCGDFETDYESFKNKCLATHPENLRLIKRPTYEMIEFFDPESDVLAYVVSSERTSTETPR